jgi:ElaB/YqjD/DUF883 family membrane-anchored ribosome-binding protein
MGTKAEYQERVESELQVISDQIEAWSVKAARSEGEVRVEFERQLDELRRIQNRGESGLKELKEEGEDTWESVRPRLDGVLSELRHAILNIGSRFH